MINSEYTITECKSISDLVDYKKCFEDNGSPKTIERLEWMHLDNTMKKPIVNFAKEKVSNEIGGIYAVFPCKYKVQNRVVLGCQSIDTLTDKNHRKKGLFKDLAKSVFAKCIAEKVNFVYGFPNIHSAFAFFNRLDWKEISEVPFKILILNTSYIKSKVKAKSKLLARFIPSISLGKQSVKLSSNEKIEKLDSFDNRTTDVWNSFSNSIEIGLNQDHDYLNWRIVDKPGENYTSKAFFVKEELVAYVIYCVKQKHGGSIGYIMDIIYKQENKNEGKKLLKYAISEIRGQGSELILAWNFDHSINSEIYKVTKFKKLAEWMRPIKLHFGALSFEDNENDFFFDKKNWYLSYLDSDTV